MNGSIRESKSKEELEEFFEKMATPFKRPGTAPNQRSNDGTLRSHWAWEDHAPPTTWGQLAAQVRCRLSSPLHSACLCPARRLLVHASRALLGAGSRCTVHTTQWYDAGAASDERGFVRLCQCKYKSFGNSAVISAASL